MQKNEEYVIFRIINNNVVTSLDEQSSEVVLMGKGISYKKKVGDCVDFASIDKVFVLKGKEKNRYMDIIKHISIQYFDIAADILEMAEKELNVKANPIGYIMLADHIASAIERAKDNIFIENEMLKEIRFFYPKEFEIGKKALNIVEAQFHIKLPIDEAGFITFHIISLSEGMDSASRQRLRMINAVIEMVESYFTINFDRESIYFERFLTHLKYFCVRTYAKDNEAKQGDSDDFLYRMLKIQYPEVTKCTELIQEYLMYNYQIKVSNEEKGFLIVHINNLLMNSTIAT